MTIKEVEEKTGLTRSNIRFYEKEHLIQPVRKERNGYRDYTESNVEDIKKIAYLRTLGISIENIHKIINQEISLMEVISAQEKILDEQIIDLEKAKVICRQMLQEENVTYENLDIEAYVPELPTYWEKYKKIFQMDSAGFLSFCGGTFVWGMITVVSLIIALCSYPYLPELIPVQYSGGQASSLVNKNFIFVYPIVCVILRLFFKRYFRWKMLMTDRDLNDMISDYVTNFMCFVALTTQIFSVLFVYGHAKNAVLMLSVDGLVFLGLLIKGLMKLNIS